MPVNDAKLITPDEVSTAIGRLLHGRDLAAATAAVAPLTVPDALFVLERLDDRDRAVLFRLLPKGKALEVFEGLDASLQGDLVHALKDEEFAEVFAELDPDDRVSLLDELPATVAARLLEGLPAGERDLTAEVLGYPRGSIGRRMSPQYVSASPRLTAGETLARLRSRLGDAETVYTVPVVADGRRLVGIVSLRELMSATPETPVGEIMREAYSVRASFPAEGAARRCAYLKVLALPVVDEESRLVGILTVDDALAILEEADSEDQARISGSEPLRRPYLSTPVRKIVRARVVWGSRCWRSARPSPCRCSRSSRPPWSSRSSSLSSSPCS